jgi:hypothetical protein
MKVAIVVATVFWPVHHRYPAIIVVTISLFLPGAASIVAQTPPGGDQTFKNLSIEDLSKIDLTSVFRSVR